MIKKSSLIFLAIILAAGLFLRINNIYDNYYFSGELGKEMLYIKKFVDTKTIPLAGMPTSHEWLSYGPIYYWIMMPIFNLFNGNPFILFWISLAVSLIGLILNYIVLKKITDEKIALLSTALQAVSPLMIWQTRLSKLHVFFFALMPLLMLFMYYLWNGNKKWIIPAGLLFGILFSFHFSQIPLLGMVILLFLIKKKIYKFTDYLKFGIGVLIPNITYIWKDASIALWVPYRVLNIANKNLTQTLSAINEYFGKNFFWDFNLWIFGSVIAGLIFINYAYKNRRNITKKFLPFYLVTSIGLMLTGNILHGTPPVHYFLPVFTTTLIMLSIYLKNIRYGFLLFIPLMAINWLAFQEDPLFYKEFTGNVKGTDFVSYKTQQQITASILAQADGNTVSVKRIGPYDYFPENYSQNYKYLIFYMGGIVIDNAKNIYTIVEDESGVYAQK